MVDESAVADAKEALKKEEFQFKICEEQLEAAKAALKKALEAVWEQFDHLWIIESAVVE